jgi:hypothetical protein
MAPKGAELGDVLAVMARWSDWWLSGEAGPPILHRHPRCGHIMRVEPHGSESGAPVHAVDLDVAHACPF